MTTTIPKTCKAIVLDGPREPWALREVPVELPKEGEILIKSLACGVCHSVCLTMRSIYNIWDETNNVNENL